MYKLTMNRFIFRAMGVLIPLVAWELVSASGIVDQDLLPRLSTIAGSFIDFVSTQVFWLEAATTAFRALTGLIVATIIALALAILSGRYKRLRRMFDPMSDFLRAIPPPALMPLAVFVVGLGTSLYIVVIAFGCIWPIYIATSNALAHPEPVQMHTARCFGLSEWQTMWFVRIPAAMPAAMTGLRLSAGVALLATVATEMLMGSNGLGALMFNAGFSLLWNDMYALMIVTGFLGLSFNAIVGTLKRGLTGWQLRLSEIGAAK